MKYLISAFIFSLLLSAQSIAQPYSIGETSITFTDASRNNRSVPTEIYYPAQSAGTNTAVAAGEHCTIVFGHGFLIGYSQYEWLANALVPQGYIVAFPDTETGFPNHGNFGGDLAFLVNAIQNEGNTNGSVLFGSVSPNSAIGGHSMGGGASFLGAENNSTINALFNFAAAETNPSAIAAASNVLVPTLIFEGTEDCVTPSIGNTFDMYSNLNTSCNNLVSINGASHCQFANSDFICTLGELSCSPTISQNEQESAVIDYLLPFLNFHLKNDCSAATSFNNIITNPTNASVNSNCNLSNNIPVSIINLPPIVLNNTPINLQANPPGGIFSGNGVVFSAFNPALFGTGTFTITYTYTDPYGCIGIDEATIIVGSISYNFVNYNLGTISP